MKAKGNSRFDIDALRDLAGEKVFERGVAYHRAGQVVILRIEPGRVLARVAGTEDYRTELTGRGKNIDGECSCRAFADWGFCKHMVATALAANAAGTDAQATGAGTLARIREHLKQKEVDALVEMIVDLAERDAALFRKLELATLAVDTDAKTLEARMRRAIDGATRTRGFVDYGEAGGWATAVDETLDALSALNLGGRAGLVLKLAAHAIDRIENAIASIDDSDGHCSGLLERARDIHIAAARVARPDSLALARDLFAREMADEYDIFNAAASLYADTLGEKGLEEYRRLAVEAWEKLPPHRAGRQRNEFSDHYRRLAGILDFFAERDGDVDARIALRVKKLSSPWDYLQLAEFCREQGREEEALRRAEEGLWVFEDGRPDERLLFFVADLLTKAGRKDDAAAHLWRAFDKAPSVELYAGLRKLDAKAARERAIEFLQRRLAKEKPSQWHYPSDVLVSILTQEKMYDAAWAAVCRYQASKPTKDALARASERSHPREAIETYAACVEGLVNSGSGYVEAAKLISRMASLRSAEEHASYLAALKARHGRKRNLMKLLG
jgi:uncharacterized Zn finger protein